MPTQSQQVVEYEYAVYSCKDGAMLEGKVQLFWEGHKNLRHPPYGFDIYLVNVKTIRRMTQIFVAFSEKLNFNIAEELSIKCGKSKEK